MSDIQPTVNEKLYDIAKEAITDLFGDDSVSKSVCERNLKGLIEEIETMLETLHVDKTVEDEIE